MLYARILKTLILAYTMVFYQQYSLADNKIFDPENQATAGLLHLLTVAEVQIEKNDLTAINQALKNVGWDGARKECWDLRLPKHLENKAEEIIEICHNELGMKQAILPSKQNYNGVLFLGATMGRVGNRIDFYNNLVAQKVIKLELKLWVLTGERQLNPRAGETQERLNHLIPQLPLTLPNNEPEMIRLLFDHLMPSTITVEYVSSGKDPNHTRATTESTMSSFLNMHPESLQKSEQAFIAISNQPFVLYQELVIRRILQKQGRDDIKVEVIGNEAQEDIQDSNNYAATLLSTVAKNTALLTDITIEKSENKGQTPKQSH